MKRDNELSELLENLDIEAWMDSQGVDYTSTRGRSGRQLNVRVCPVCGNSDRKVYINADTGLGNCFAGSHPHGESFNKWRFLSAVMSDLPGRQVVEHLKVYSESRGWKAKSIKSARVEAPVQLVIPESVPLPYNGRNIKYLTNRGITPELAAYFHLRYCEEGNFPYQSDGRWTRMKFDKRVIIPVFDMTGKMVTFQGRDITGTAEKKYLFPPGLAASGAHLFNGFNVKPGTTRVVVGEGAFDVMALKLALDEEQSLRDVVPIGTFGKHLSGGVGDSQEAKFIELKSRGVSEVTIMWDGEIRATDDAVEAGMHLRRWGLGVRIAMLPKDADPNEVAASVVREAYFNAIPLTLAGAVGIKMRRRQMNLRA